MVLAVIFTINCNAQEKYFGIGLGLSISNIDAKKGSNCGLRFDLDYNKIHMDIAGNMADGNGDYLKFTSTGTYSLSKKLWSAFNFGYSFRLKKEGIIKYIITPKCGIVYIKEILEDSTGTKNIGVAEIPVTTHCFGEKKTRCQVGVDLGLLMNNFLFKVGVGSIENFSFSISLIIRDY